MSLPRLVLLISVLANIALGVVLVLQKQVPSGIESLHTVTAPAPTPTETAAEPVTWAHLEPLDDVAFVAALREQGWSRDVLVSIVQSRLDLEYEPKFEALTAPHRPPFWRGNHYGRLDPSLPAATRAELRQLSRELKQRLRGLLGEEAEDPAWVAHRQKRYGPIAAEKIETLEAIEADYRDLISEVRERTRGRMSDEDRDVVRLLEQEQEADLAALLTPEEKDAYDLRASRTAMSLRFRLQHFDPAEEEYVAIFRLQKAFDDRYGNGGVPTAERQQWMVDQAELNRQIATVLGEERFREYELKTHFSWRQTDDWVRQLQLPPATTEPLARLGREMQDQLQALNRDRSLSRTDRDARRTALLQQARTQLARILPAEHHAKYEAGPGNWLNALQPPTP